MDFYPPSLDAFLLVGHAVGLTDYDLAAMSGWSYKQVVYRLAILLSTGRGEAAIIAGGLPVQYRRREDGWLVVWADWRDFPGRFPHLERALRQLKEMDRGQRALPVYNHLRRRRSKEILTARGVLASWAIWHAQTPEQDTLARTITHGNVQGKTVLRWYRALRDRWGVDPMELS